MPKYCASGLCKNNAKDHPNKKFALFVQTTGRNANPNRAQIWIQLMGRQNLSLADIKNYTYVCEDHFDDNVELDYRKVSCIDKSKRFAKFRSSEKATKSHAKKTYPGILSVFVF